MKYYGTYWLIENIHDCLSNPSNYSKHFNEFFGELEYRKFIQPFPKVSALHLFIQSVLECIMLEEISDRSDIMEDSLTHDASYKLWIEESLEFHSISYVSFHKWRESLKISLEAIDEDLIYKYHNELKKEGSIDRLFKQMAEEAFFLLFLNRELLHLFNEKIAFYIRASSDAFNTFPEDIPFFKKPCMLNRATIPAWAKRAVFYRDRGCCVVCFKDISGLKNISNAKHFDHIIPLATGGINDVTNLQLLCESCNLNKGKRTIPASIKYEKWYI